MLLGFTTKLKYEKHFPEQYEKVFLFNNPEFSEAESFTQAKSKMWVGLNKYPYRHFTAIQNSVQPWVWYNEYSQTSGFSSKHTLVIIEKGHS